MMANQPGMVVMDKYRKTAIMIDVAITNDSNTRKKEDEKLEKCQGLRKLLKKMW